jgi:hypothetical protein
MPSRTKRAESSVQVRLVNPRETAVQLVLEPWGETYSIPPDSSVDIKACGPDGDALEIAHQPESIVVWGWPGSTLRVFQGSQELGSERGRPPVPAMSVDASAENGRGPVERANRGRR